METWSQPCVGDDPVQAHIRTGQAYYVQGDIQAAADHFRMALEGLMREYQEAIIAFCRNMLRGRVDHAEDIAQEVFLAIWRTMPAFRHQASIRTWIFAIARNHCRDALHHLTRAGRTEGDADEQQTPDTTPSPEERYTQQDFLAWVKQGLTQLRAEDREILVMTYITALPRAEIASLLGIAETSVGTRRKRALQRLREVIQHEKR